MRFITNYFDNDYFYADLLVGEEFPQNKKSIFSFNKREFHNQKKFNICFIVPTGIGCEIGGHAGDSTPTLKLLSTSCDKVITHPNTVNASDINEMPENALYVEGSHLTHLLMGTVALNEVSQNRILTVIDNDLENKGEFKEMAVNSVNGARATLGLSADISILNPSICMEGFLSENKAIGRISYLEHLYKTLKEKEGFYDAVAITTQIKVEEKLHNEYSKSGGDMLNPWGAVESMLTHFISSEFNCPSAHAPMFESKKISNLNFGVVDARIAPEVVSNTFFHCVLKGLHRAPRIINNKKLFNLDNIFSVKDISAIVIPDGILGLPVLAALHQGIKVIAVKNKNSMKNNLLKLPWAEGQFYQCDNYLEACGVLNCLKAGVSVETVKRPLKTLMLEKKNREGTSVFNDTVTNDNSLDLNPPS
ncbi:MAG: DUF3326 domain-containing protein [Bdellovibrionales bacterium]|nr:DUF3326 domain-containing protein [Bdellovibrionales bacterium]